MSNVNIIFLFYVADDLEVFLKQHWKDIAKWKNAKILALIGIHGTPDGGVAEYDEESDEDLTEEFSDVIEEFKHHEVAENDLKMNIRSIDMADFIYKDIKGENKIKFKRLAEVIREYDPNVLILGYCYTQKSDLDDFLRASGKEERIEGTVD